MKLLNYTSIRYLLFTALMLLISIPVFYVVLNKVFILSIDKDLYQQASEIPSQQNAIKSGRDLELWRKLDNDLEIVSANNIVFHKNPYTEKESASGAEEIEDYRILEKKIRMLDADYIVRIKSSMIEKEDLVQTILAIQLSLFFLLLLGATVINYFINKRIWKPFYDNLTFLQNFELESPVAESAENSNIREFKQLNRSIRQLTISVHNAYASQKEFTENASHELQTPLSVLKFKLELLLQEKGLSENQSELIDDMYQVIDQLEQLNKNLLLLSKIENNQFAFGEKINIIQTLNEVANQLQFMADAKHQIIEIISTQEYNFISGNRQLFKNMIKNLLRNAIQYSNEAAIISIKMDTGFITIDNPGIPLDIAQDKLFSRFSKAGNQKGNGLGLAIAKKIAELHRFSLHYHFTAGKHSFQIQL